jgi:hypothetical protein
MTVSVKETLFSEISKEDNTRALAAHMPIGKLWEKSFDINSNLGKLIDGLAEEFYRSCVAVSNISNEMRINETTELLPEWEDSVGIPSDIFETLATSIEDRRKNIQYLFTNFWGVQTASDFERVAGYYGYNVEVEPATKKLTFPLYFPIFFSTSKSVKNTIVVIYESTEGGNSYFPLYFPYYFSDGGIAFLIELFRILAPANVEVKFVNSDNTEPVFIGPFSFSDVDSYLFADIDDFTFVDLYSA